MKKIILTVFAATSLLLYSTPSFAFSISVGVPVGSTITAGVDPWGHKNEADGTSGYFLGVQLPFGLGLGMDSHKTKLKDTTDNNLETSMYNLYYQLPVPVVSLIVGLGTGKQTLECSTCAEGTMFSYKEDGTDYTENIGYKPGSVTQWYTSIGFPIIPFFDIHLSYRSITSKNIEYGGATKLDFSSTITGIGLAFNF